MSNGGASGSRGSSSLVGKRSEWAMTRSPGSSPETTSANSVSVRAQLDGFPLPAGPGRRVHGHCGERLVADPPDGLEWNTGYPTPGLYQELELGAQARS